MALEHCILHHLTRDGETAPLNLKVREEESGTEDAIYSLYEQLRQTFNRNSTRQFGQFDSERGDNPFPAQLDKFKEEPAIFTRMTQKVMEHLKQTFDALAQPIDAHVMFAVETSVNQTVLYMFWMEHQAAMHITAAQEIESVEYIEPKNLVAALSVNLSDFHEVPEAKYLSVMKGRGYKEVGEFFENFSCFTTQISTAAETEAFLEVVEKFTEEMPEEEGQSKRNDIIDYCIEQNMAGEPVNVEALSAIINEDEPEQFTQFVETNQDKPQTVIHTHRPSLKKYGRYSGRDKDISLSFNATLVGEAIEYNPTDNTLVIRHIPKGLKEQLVKALQKEREGSE